jgi:hypothetical protein
MNIPAKSSGHLCTRASEKKTRRRPRERGPAALEAMGQRGMFSTAESLTFG